MAFLIKTNNGNGIDLVLLRDIVLKGISGLREAGERYRVEQSVPKVISSKPGYDMYILGTVNYTNSMDRVFAFNLRHPETVFSEEDFDALLERQLVPNWYVSLGVESANGFDVGILHKNLSEGQVLEAKVIGQRIKTEVPNIADVLFEHSWVDNREVIRLFEEC